MTTIRAATPADADGATAVAMGAFAVYVPPMGVEPWPMKVDYLKLIGRGHVWVAVDDGEVVGVLVLEPHHDHLLIDVVAVAPDQQGSGLGTRLLDLAEEQAWARGLDEVRLFTNEAMTENLAYYERHGYVETRRERQDGYARVFFVKRLAG